MLLPAVFHENLFDDWFDPFFEMDRAFDRGNRGNGGNRAANMMKTDVKEVEGGYEMDIDLPGCKKEDVKMQLEDGYLTIQAVRNHTTNEDNRNGRYIRRESFSGTCARTFYVGENIKKEDIHAKFENGVLRVTLPRAEAKKELPRVNPNLIDIE